jgi:dihydrodiol dehydrogenase / D-xylose 1-dehydrogenase (NADP)
MDCMTLTHLSRPPASDRPIGWGILGTGAIAHRFAEDFVHVKDGILLAAGSRSEEKAKAFADRFRIPYRYGSYRALADDRRVDAVYIATPASEHKAGIELCLRAGKAVLCEKPLTVNAREAEDVIALARQSGGFLMEGMWTRCLPLIALVRKLLAQHLIGEVRHVMADVASDVEFDPASRVFSVELGGGALLQKGVYLLSLTSMILGPPTRIKSFSVFAESGIDESTGILMEYSKGALATLWCSVRVRGHRRAIISGTHGQLIIHDPIICPSTLTLRLYGSSKRLQDPPTKTGTSPKAQIIRHAKSSLFVRKLRERFPMLGDRLLYGIRSSRLCAPPLGEGLHYQVAEVNRCLRAGQLESHVMPLNESLSIMATMDLIRAEQKTATNAL